MTAQSNLRRSDVGGCNCSRTHRSPAHHHVYGYERLPDDPRLSYEPFVAERGIALSDCDEADRVRAAAMEERPDLNWHVEWVLMRL